VSVHLSGKGYQVTAADVSPAMLALARDNFGAGSEDLGEQEEFGGTQLHGPGL